MKGYSTANPVATWTMSYDGGAEMRNRCVLTRIDAIEE
jgi:hypothetical protein